MEYAAVEKFRQMIQDDQTLSALDDEFLLKFLRVRKFDYERSLQLLRRYHAMRKDYPEYYKNYSPILPKMMAALDMNYFDVLSGQDANNSCIITILLGKWDPHICPLDDCFIIFQLLLDVALEDPAAQMNGITIVVDCKDFSFKHMTAFGVRSMRRIFLIIQGSYPVRFKAFHLINENYFFRMAYMIAAPLLKKKIRNRIHFHGANFNSFHQCFNPSILSEEFGGSLPPLDNTALVHRFAKLNDKIVKINQYFT